MQDQFTAIENDIKAKVANTRNSLREAQIRHDYAITCAFSVQSVIDRERKKMQEVKK